VAAVKLLEAKLESFPNADTNHTFSAALNDIGKFVSSLGFSIKADSCFTKALLRRRLVGYSGSDSRTNKSFTLEVSNLSLNNHSRTSKQHCSERHCSRIDSAWCIDGGRTLHCASMSVGSNASLGSDRGSAVHHHFWAASTESLCAHRVKRSGQTNFQADALWPDKRSGRCVMARQMFRQMRYGQRSYKESGTCALIPCQARVTPDLAEKTD